MSVLIQKRARVIGFIVTILLLSGCAGQTYNIKALKKPNRFAIVSVTGITTGFGMSDKEEITLLTSIEKLVYKELKQSKNFKLVPPSKVKKNRNYRSIKGETESGFMTTNVAKGYKKFDIDAETKSVEKLMKDLNLTGVIHITASFTKEDSGFSLSGFLPIPIPITAGATSGKIMFHIVALDRKNEVIWQDLVEMETKDSVGTVMGVSNIKKLYPQFLDIAQESAKMAVKNLSENLL